jgi:hypothetical protein
MLNNEATNERSQSASFHIIAIVIMMILMGLFVKYFFKSELEISKTNFNVLTRNFVEVINIAHVEWMRQGKPDNIYLNYLDKATVQQQWLKMNQYGWPLLETKDVLGCQSLWGTLLAQPMENMKHPIITDYITNLNDHFSLKNGEYCQFVYNKEYKLKYFPKTGAVLIKSD